MVSGYSTSTGIPRVDELSQNLSLNFIIFFCNKKFSVIYLVAKFIYLKIKYFVIECQISSQIIL